jgi:hypothetical protein
MMQRNGGFSSEIAMHLDMATDCLAMFRGEMPYMDFFGKRVGGEKIFAEITPSYQLLDAPVYKMMSDIHPDVRFVFIMRDPVDRCWSQFRMTRRNRSVEMVNQDFVRLVGGPQMTLRGDYKRTIEELEKSVSPTHIKYLFFENMFTPEAMKGLTDFLGVDEWPADFDEKSNVSPPAKLEPELAKLAFDRFRHVYEFIASRFGEQLPQLWRATMDRYA